MRFKDSKRKLIGINYSLLLTLPKVWVEGMDLSAGDEVIVSNEGDNLIIKPIKKDKKK